MNYRGILIEESLKNKNILSGLCILKTDIEPVSESDNTPWLQKWTMHTIEIPSGSAEKWMQVISENLDEEHPWFADFKNEHHHFIIYRDRYYKVDLHNPDYDDARRHGILLGIPDYQLDFK